MYKVLGERRAEARELLRAENQEELEPTTIALLDQAVCLPFCEAVGAYEGDEWTKDILSNRSEGLAYRIWQKSHSWLHDF